MKLTKSEAKSRGDALSSAAKAVAEIGKNWADGLPNDFDTDVLAAYRNKLTELTAALQNLGEAASKISVDVPAGPVDERAYRPRFQDFLSEVGGALLGAQRQLDHASAQYLQETQPQKHILPSVFRVPKLAASMKFALEKDQKEGVNLVFFSKSAEARERHQQSIDFEIVSVPAPPEAVRNLAAPRFQLLLDPQRRAEVLALALAAAEKEMAGFDTDRILLIQLLDEQYLLFYADAKQENNVGLWIFSGTGEEPSLTSVYKLKKKVAVSEIELRKLISELGDRQAAFLTGA